MYLAAEPNGLATSWDPPTNFAKLENSPNWWKNLHRLWLENKIRMPTADEAKDIAKRWEAKWIFPQAYGAIDGTHIQGRRHRGGSGGSRPPQLPAGPLFTEFAGTHIWRQKVMVTLCT